jgi:hypothetical protein
MVAISTLSGRYPVLYHMAEYGSWPSIRLHGLLSTSSLLNLFEVVGADRIQIECHRRTESIQIRHPKHGVAVVRDQKPMDDLGLRRALKDNLTPGEWYQILNGMVFFWLTEERLDRLRGARPYRNTSHTILHVDTRALLERHAERVRLSPINSGCTKPYPAPRGRDTFLSLEEYPFDQWNKKRSGKDPVVELAVKGGVTDISDFVIRVLEVGPEIRRVVFQR